MKADIKEWDPEDPKKWDKRLAWTTVWISTFSLTFGFCAWYLVPSLAPHLNAVGFHLDASQLYWLVAMVGLSAGTLRILWTFLPPIMGTRKLVFMSTILLLIPLGCWIYAVTNPGLPFEVLMLFAFLAGIGGRHLLRTHGVHQLLLPEEQARLCPRRTMRPVGLRHLACPIRNADSSSRFLYLGSWALRSMRS